MSGVPMRYVRKYRVASSETSPGNSITPSNDGSATDPMIAIATPSTKANTVPSPESRAASSARPSPNRRAATDVNPTPTISASEMMAQIQKSDVDTAARPAEPMRVPTQKASTEEKSVIN